MARKKEHGEVQLPITLAQRVARVNIGRAAEGAPLISVNYARGFLDACLNFNLREEVSNKEIVHIPHIGVVSIHQPVVQLAQDLFPELGSLHTIDAHGSRRKSYTVRTNSNMRSRAILESLYIPGTGFSLLPTKKALLMHMVSFLDELDIVGERNIGGSAFLTFQRTLQEIKKTANEYIWLPNSHELSGMTDGGRGGLSSFFEDGEIGVRYTVRGNEVGLYRALLRKYGGDLDRSENEYATSGGKYTLSLTQRQRYDIQPNGARVYKSDFLGDLSATIIKKPLVDLAKELLYQKVQTGFRRGRGNNQKTLFRQLQADYEPLFKQYE